MSWLQNQQLTTVCVGFVLWTRRGESAGRLSPAQRETKQDRVGGASTSSGFPAPRQSPKPRGGGQLETHQIPRLQHAHEGTRDHTPLRAERRAGSDQAPGPPALPMRTVPGLQNRGFQMEGASSAPQEKGPQE